MIGPILEIPYRFAVALRNAFYRWGMFKVHRLPKPVICVGNLTFGGTGKTPTVLYLAKDIQRLGRQVGVLSRGYAGDKRGNDESRMMQDYIPGLPHVQNPDRFQGGLELIAEFPVDIILLDDGFQHLRLARDLNIVLVDALDPFGGGVCPPLGRLRESLSGLQRADVVILTRADLVSPEARDEIWAKINRWKTKLPRIEMGYKITGVLETETGKLHDIHVLRGRGATLVCAIGNPSGFQRMVENTGIQVRSMMSFLDHHPYSRSDMEKVFSRDQYAVVVTTHKDWVKIREIGPPFYPWVVEIEPVFLRGQDFLDQKIDDVLHGRPV